MSMRNKVNLNPHCVYDRPYVVIEEEEEEGGDNLFNPEAGRASDNPFAHAQTVESLEESTDSNQKVSKYVGETEEE